MHISPLLSKAPYFEPVCRFSILLPGLLRQGTTTIYQMVLFWRVIDRPGLVYCSIQGCLELASLLQFHRTFYDMVLFFGPTHGIFMLALKLAPCWRRALRFIALFTQCVNLDLSRLSRLYPNSSRPTLPVTVLLRMEQPKQIGSRLWEIASGAFLSLLWVFSRITWC